MNEGKRVLVLGGTGRAGRLVVQKCLERGYVVTVLSRSAEKAKKLEPRANVIEGDAHDAAAVERAVTGQDAVVVAIGAPDLSKAANEGYQAKATQHVCDAMKKLGVGRLVVLSALGVGESRAWLPPIIGSIVVFFLRHVFADKAIQEKITQESGLEWVLVRPPALQDKPSRGPLKAKENASANGVSYVDVAEFMVNQITDNTWVRRGPAVGYSL